MKSDNEILEAGGTQEDINNYAHDVGGACGAAYGGTCDHPTCEFNENKSETMTNQASEDELKERIGNLHAYNFDGDDVTVKVMVDEDILESIAKYVKALIRTEKLKLLAEVRERVVGRDEREILIPAKPRQGLPAKDGIAVMHNKLRAEQREAITKLEAEL